MAWREVGMGRNTPGNRRGHEFTTVSGEWRVHGIHYTVFSTHMYSWPLYSRGLHARVHWRADSFQQIPVPFSVCGGLNVCGDLHHFIGETWASIDFDIHGGSKTSPHGNQGTTYVSEESELYANFRLHGGIPNPCVVQGSTAYYISLKRNFVFTFYFSFQLRERCEVPSERRVIL